MHINATSLTMMNVTFYDGWIGSGLHFETSDAIVMDVVFLEITL